MHFLSSLLTVLMQILKVIHKIDIIFPSDNDGKNDGVSHYDIAVLTLSSPVTFSRNISPVYLPASLQTRRSLTQDRMPSLLDGVEQSLVMFPT